MSGPEGTGARRPLRSAGWAMLALAVVAALIGLAIVVTGEAGTSAGGRSTAASEPAPESASPALPPPAVTGTSSPAATPEPSPAAIPEPSPADSGPTNASPTNPSPVNPGSAGGAQSGTGASAGRPTRGEARVYNNSTISGLAARAADDLNAAGWTVVEVDNYAGGRIPTTTVYYQEGTDQRRIAEAIGAEFGMRVQPRFVGIANAEPGVIVIVTNDYGS